MSEKRKGHKFTEEHNAKISRALKGIPKSEEHKLKQRMTMTGRKASKEKQPQLRSVCECFESDIKWRRDRDDGA